MEKRAKEPTLDAAAKSFGSGTFCPPSETGGEQLPLNGQGQANNALSARAAPLFSGSRPPTGRQEGIMLESVFLEAF